MDGCLVQGLFPALSLQYVTSGYSTSKIMKGWMHAYFIHLFFNYYWFWCESKISHSLIYDVFWSVSVLGCNLYYSDSVIILKYIWTIEGHMTGECLVLLPHIKKFPVWIPVRLKAFLWAVFMCACRFSPGTVVFVTVRLHGLCVYVPCENVSIPSIQLTQNVIFV